MIYRLIVAMAAIGDEPPLEISQRCCCLILINVQRDAKICSLYFIALSLYMFRVPFTPIIRST